MEMDLNTVNLWLDGQHANSPWLTPWHVWIPREWSDDEDEYGDSFWTTLPEAVSYIVEVLALRENFYVLIAEGGGWPTHAIGPFYTFDRAEAYIAADKWRQSWGSVSTDPRDLNVEAPT